MPLSGSRATNCYPTDYPASACGPNYYAKTPDFIGGRTRTRTLDPLIKSQRVQDCFGLPAITLDRLAGASIAESAYSHRRAMIKTETPIS
jgi:hypothetical protein